MTKQPSIEILRGVAALRDRVASWRRQGLRIGMVPTMGALHDGHLTLVRHALGRCDRVLVSIFVNPTQFGPNEDFARYPRDEDADAAKLEGAGCHLLFAPPVEEMYPAAFATTVSPGPLTERLCGRFRPGHFAGVATIVTKLLLQAQPDLACFGEKDYQQLQVINRVVRDLDIPTAIEGVPTVREADGLAMSSRNRYLSAEQRKAAAMLYQVLGRIARRLGKEGGGTEAGEIAAAVDEGKAALIESGFTRIDYLEICDAQTLETLTTLAPGTLPERNARILAAAWLGGTRLIDNIPLSPP